MLTAPENEKGGNEVFFWITDININYLLSSIYVGPFFIISH